MKTNDHSEREAQVYAYVEGLLDGDELRRFEALLKTDRELEAEVHRARLLLSDLSGLDEDQEPTRDLWPSIHARLERSTEGEAEPQVADIKSIRRRQPRRVTMGVPQLIAAGIATVLLSGGGTWLAMRTAATLDTAIVDPVTPPPSTTGAVVPDFASDAAFRDYDRAVSQLQTILDAGRDRLSPETLQILEESLASIDTAIRDARRALAEDPENGALNQLLGRHLKTKLDLLRRTAAALQSNA